MYNVLFFWMIHRRCFHIYQVCLSIFIPTFERVRHQPSTPPGIKDETTPVYPSVIKTTQPGKNGQISSLPTIYSLLKEWQMCDTQPKQGTYLLGKNKQQIAKLTATVFHSLITFIPPKMCTLWKQLSFCWPFESPSRVVDASPLIKSAEGGDVVFKWYELIP